MRVLIILFIAFGYPVLVTGQVSDTLINSTDSINEVVVYANKFPEHSKRISQTIKVIRDRAVLNFQPNTGDVLINTGSLFVQKSQQGGGSPVIRGFEASRIVLIVDGIRMNNAIYRAGHLQNVITVDNAVLDRMEILYGPSSTLYGSDALGGVINLSTVDPKLSKEGRLKVTGNAIGRYASAIEEGRGHIDVNIGGKKWASFTSVSHASYGDVKQGKNRSNKYPGFGEKRFIVKRVGATDSAFVNPDPLKQSPSGYSQTDVLQKILFQPAANIQHILNLQFSTSSDIPRYDRLSEVASGQPVFAEWYYGPQVRNAGAYQLNASGLQGFFREIKVNASFQDVRESRINRRFKNNNRNYNREQVNVFGLNLDAKRYIRKHELHLGAESYTNFVKSTAEGINIVTGAASKIQTRYSDGPTKMGYNAVYGQHTLKISDNWTLNDGLRLNLVSLDAVFADTSILHLPFSTAKQNNVAVTGNLGLIYAVGNHFKTALLLSSGFRAPNVDDLTKVFDSRVGTVIVPNADLRPEYTYNAEMNVSRNTSRLSYGAAVFYTLFRNGLVMDHYQFRGQDSIVYLGVNSAVFAMQNKARAYIYGFSVNATATLIEKTTLDGVASYSYGRYKSNGVVVPLDHIPPMYGRMGLKHSRSKWQAEFYALFNGWKRIEDYSPSGEDNQQYATPDGMPAWYTLNLKLVASAGKHLQAQLVVENILDRNYRYFASGISAPGRNIGVSVKYGF